MKICELSKRVVNFVKNQAAETSGAVSKKYGAEMSKVTSEVAAKAPNYAAVEVNGLIVYMPVEQAAKTQGAKILQDGLSSVDDVLKAMQTHCNIVQP